MENAAPELHKQADERVLDASAFDDDVADPFDAREVFDLIRDINDPEHPHTLEELNVVQLGSFCAGNAVCGAGRHAQAVKHTQTHTHTHRHTDTHTHTDTDTQTHTHTHTSQPQPSSPLPPPAKARKGEKELTLSGSPPKTLMFF